MESMILVLTPRECANLLNRNLFVLARKRFPEDYVGWVYVYCAKNHNSLLHKNCANIWWVEDKDFQKKNKRLGIKVEPIFNGKVIARFWCDKVEEISKIIMYNRPYDLFETETLQPTELLKQSCLRATEMTKYFMFSNLSKESAAIHITKVEPLDKPKEISDFYAYSDKKLKLNYHQEARWLTSLTHAPTTYCYIEVDA